MELELNQNRNDAGSQKLRKMNKSTSESVADGRIMLKTDLGMKT